MNAPCSGALLTAPHVTSGGLCRWKAINKVGRHVGLDFYDLLIDRRPLHCQGLVADLFKRAMADPHSQILLKPIRPKVGSLRQPLGIVQVSLCR
jgi:hypothetical protein